MQILLLFLLLTGVTASRDSHRTGVIESRQWPAGTTGQASSKLFVHYFYHSGWMIETANHLLVFDFIAYPEGGIDYTSLEQALTNQNAAGKKIYIFISHEHDDHFNKELFAIQNKLKNVSFVLGWKYAEAEPQAYTLAPGDSLYLAGIKVNTHISTDAGSAFLVRVDGFTFYHSGDHALWSEAERSLFISELKSLQPHFKSVDLAFLVAARGMRGGCISTNSIVEGIGISAGILKPSVIALQHIGCPDKLPQYKTVQTQVGKFSKRWITPVAYNESFDLSK